MSLQTKFAILLAAFGMAVLIALAAAWWSLEVTYREVRGPVESSSNVLNLLVSIEEEVDALRALAGPDEAFRTVFNASKRRSVPSASGLSLTLERYERHAAAIDELLKAIDAEAEWAGYAGKTAKRNLEARVTDLHEAARGWSHLPTSADFSPAPPGSINRVRNQLFQIHELVKAMERRVVEDIQKLATSGLNLRLRLLVVLGLSLLLVVLTAALGVLLIRRWIIHPVSDLRTATARIGAGDFEYRIPIARPSARDEITALSGEVNHMAGMVKELQRERVEQERLAAVGEMVRRLAHNLRNPLAGIRGLAELTRSDVAALGPAADDVRETQRRIISTVDRFESWLSDLLNVTKPAQIHTEATNANRWLAGLAEAHLPLAQTRGVTLTVDQTTGPDTANFDRRHLEHALSAIVSNAIEASAAGRRPGRPPAVRIVSTTVQAGEAGPIWELRVEDTGPGVPPNLREAIFKPYFTTKPDGNGIGLAVAQQVVRAHGGRITVEGSTNGVSGQAGPVEPSGAVFVIRLPREGRPEGDAEVARIGQ